GAIRGRTPPHHKTCSEETAHPTGDAHSTRTPGAWFTSPHRVPRPGTPTLAESQPAGLPGDEHKSTHPQNPPRQGGPPTTEPQVKGRIHRITPEEPLDRPAAAAPLRRSRPFPTAFE